MVAAAEEEGEESLCARPFLLPTMSSANIASKALGSFSRICVHQAPRAVVEEAI